jgi:hypothetical protein
LFARRLAAYPSKGYVREPPNALYIVAVFSPKQTIYRCTSILRLISKGHEMNNSARNSRAQNIQGGRLLKWKGRIVSAAPGALLASVSAIALSIAPVLADQAGDISTVLTTPQTLTSDEDLTITDTGAIELSSASSAAALTIDLSYSKTFINDGMISSRREAGAGGRIFIDGLFINGLSEGGTLSNTGSILIDIEGPTNDNTVYVTGIEIHDEFAGLFDNSGTIEVYALTHAGEVNATGLYTVDDIAETGQFLNSGTFTVQAESTFGSVSATAFETHYSIEGLFENIGTLEAYAISGGDNPWSDATGVSLSDPMKATGQILNSGVIIADVQVIVADPSVGDDGYAKAQAQGIDAYGGNNDAMHGLIDNSGIISVHASVNVGRALGYGITTYGYNSQVWTVEIDNSGTIEVVVEGSTATGYGIQVSGMMGGMITNIGTMTVSSIAVGQSAIAYALNFERDFLGVIDNSGAIEAYALSGGSAASAWGINVEGDVNETGQILNSDSIIVEADAETNANANGIVVTGSVAGVIDNSGTITVTAEVNAEAGIADAYGVKVNTMDGTFANSGVITASASADTGEAKAYGISVGDFNGEITDLGTINVSAADEQYAVYLGSGTGTMNVDTFDNVDGLMRVNEHNVNLDAVGGSRVFRFEDASAGVGTFETFTSDPTSAWFVDDKNGDMPVYVAVDSADVSVDTNAVAALGAQMVAFSDQLGGSADVLSRSKTSLLGGTLRPFASVGGQRISHDASSTASAMDVNIANVTVGMSGTIGNGMDVAFGFGAFNSLAKTAATDVDAEGFYLGGSVGRSFGAFDLNAGLGFGLLASDRARTVSGETASSSFDSDFFTAHVGAERGFQLSNGLNLTGYGQVRFTRQNDDGYTETGSSANLTVGDLATNVTEVTLGAEVSKTLENGGIISAHATAISRNVSGDSDVSVSVFGENANIQSSNSDFSGLNVGFGYETEIVENAILNIALDHDLGDNGSGPNLSAGMTWNF